MIPILVFLLCSPMTPPLCLMKVVVKEFVKVIMVGVVNSDLVGDNGGFGCGVEMETWKNLTEKRLIFLQIK